MTEQTPHERLADHFLADAHERVRFQHDYALQGFKALILLNGGAIIALLTYAGHEAGKAAATGFGHAFIAYAIGLVTATLAYLASYLSQSEFADHSMLESYRQLGVEVPKIRKPQPELVKSGTRAVNVGIGLSVGSLAAFVTGSALAMAALT